MSDRQLPLFELPLVVDRRIGEFVRGSSEGHSLGRPPWLECRKMH
jgi:hypothetical protein